MDQNRTVTAVYHHHTGPCSAPLQGTWKITSFYTPRQEDFPDDMGVPDEILPLAGGATFAIKQEFWEELSEEGWGQIDPSIPGLGGQYISGFTFGGVHLLSPYPLGNASNALVPLLSLATRQSQIPFGRRVRMELPAKNGFGGGEVCGRADDVGEGILVGHIDVYVGVRSPMNSGRSDRYEPFLMNSHPVGVEPATN